MARKRVKQPKTVGEIVERYSRGWWFHWLLRKPKLPDLPVEEDKSQG